MKRNIMKIRLLGTLACLVLLCLSGVAWGSTLSLQTTDGSAAKAMFLQGQDLYLDVRIDDMTGVAGCAFTLTYPSAVLEFVGTDANGMSAAITSPVFNFVQGSTTTKTHREHAAAGKIMLSGAAINTSGASCAANSSRGGSAYTGDQTLFTIRFKLKADATISNYSFSLGKTTLTNTDAGYPAGGEEIPVLIGAVPCSDSNWGTLSAAFPDKTGELTAFPLASAANFAVLDGSIINDTTPPTGAIAFAEGDVTKSLNVNLNIIASDNLGVITAMKISNTNPGPLPANWSAITEKTFATTMAWTLATGDGLKTVYARFKDAAGNWSDVVNDTITLDTKVPVTTPNWPGGGYKAGSYPLSVALTPADANPGSTTYYVINNPTALPAAFTPYTAPVVISQPDSGKTNTLRFYSKDAAGNMELVKSALYTNSADAVKPTGTVKINNGALATSTENVTLNLSATDASGLLLVGVSNTAIDCVATFGTTLPYAATVSWTLEAATEGSKAVWVCFMDKQNNWSAAAASNTILLDKTKPEGSISISGNCTSNFETTTLGTVTLTLSATDTAPGEVAFMQFSNNGTTWPATWEAYNTTRTGWALTTGNGPKTVYARFKDKAGNISDAVLDTIDRAATCTSADTFELGKGVAAGGSVYYVGLAGSDGTMKVSWVERGASGSTLTQTLELAGYSFGDALAVDGQGNIYATGVASGALYLAKYDSTGYELWHVPIGTSADVVSAMSVRSDGTSYVVKPAAGGGIVLSTFNSSGVQQGGDIPLNLPAGDEVYAATRDGAGNIYLAGEMSETSDGFVAGYPASGGNAQWTQPIGGISGSGGYGLTTDGSNNVYVTGYAYGSLGSDISAGASDCFLAKYDSAGIPQWVRLYGTAANDWGGGVAVDAGNNVWVTGSSGVIVGGKPTAGYEMFLLKYDASGVLQP